jgi:hypothetical protein
MLIMRPDELADATNPDVACTLGLQFMLRAGRLHASAYMRGNDAMIGSAWRGDRPLRFRGTGRSDAASSVTRLPAVWFEGRRLLWLISTV